MAVVQQGAGRGPEGALGERRSWSARAVQGHITGLDGVRAFAVVAVLAFHLWPARLPGGFLGVDVFFVISGFLITTLLVREARSAGRIDFPSFWLRRARRLLPALLLVVVTVIVAAQIIDRELLVGIDRQALGALTFSTNWLEINAGADYFNHTAPVLLAPFWSLAVEEQFYLFWPLVLLGILKLAPPGWPRVLIVSGAGLLSATLMVVLFEPGENPTRVYYGTDTHLFGLMLGAALALAFADGVGVVNQARWSRLRQWVGFPALVGLGVLVFVLSDTSALTYRGGLLLASVLAAVVIASLPGPRTAFSSMFTVRPVAWVGERSYGIYLWHWPVILLVTAARPAIAPGSEPDAITVGVSLVLTLLLAAASYRWLEMPVRQHGVPGLRGATSGARAGWVAAGALALTALLIVVSAPTKSGSELAVEAGERAIAEQQAQAAAAPGSATTTVPEVDADEPAPAWPPGQPLPPGTDMAAFGDSVMSGAAPALFERFPGITVEAEPNRQWRDAPALVDATIAAGTIRPVVVLQFGTNAGLQSEESQQALAQVLDALGPGRRVVLVNTIGVSHWVEATNATLATSVADRSNVAVADWYTVVQGNPALVHSDRTHPNQEGIGVYADLIATTLQQLGPGP